MSAHKNTKGLSSLRRVAPSMASFGNGRQTSADQPTATEELEYIEDMALELKRLAERAGFTALSSILDIVHREARLRRTGSPGT